MSDAATPLPPKPFDYSKAVDATRLLLEALGQGDKPEVMENTPRRVAELYAAMVNPPDIDIEADFKVFTAAPNQRGTTVTVDGAHYVSMCEHHLAPAFGVASVIYQVREKIVGYSKLKKGLNYLARGPQLNERIVADALDFVNARLEPTWIALATRSVHCCIAVRTNAPAQEIVTVHDSRGDVPQAVLDAWLGRVYASRPLFLGG